MLFYLLFQMILQLLYSQSRFLKMNEIGVYCAMPYSALMYGERGYQSGDMI